MEPGDLYYDETTDNLYLLIDVVVLEPKDFIKFAGMIIFHSTNFYLASGFTEFYKFYAVKSQTMCLLTEKEVETYFKKIADLGMTND
jgi:hypothetical protein